MGNSEKELRIHNYNYQTEGIHAWARDKREYESGMTPVFRRPDPVVDARFLQDAEERYGVIVDVFNSLPVGDAQDLVQKLDSFTGYTSDDSIVPNWQQALHLLRLDKPFGSPMKLLQHQRKEVLDALFTYDSTDQLLDEFRLDRVSEGELPKILGDEAMYELLDAMLDTPEKYRFPIGVLLTQISEKNLPGDVHEELGAVASDMEFTIQVGEGRWFLCSDAEPRLLTTLKNKAVIVVNDKLLVKFRGKLSALCLDTFSTDDGQTFFEGVWYSPIDDELRDLIVNSSDDRVGRLSVNEGAWAMMRPLAAARGKSAEEILQKAQRTAEVLPEKMPKMIGKSTRRRYRLNNQE